MSDPASRRRSSPALSVPPIALLVFGGAAAVGAFGGLGVEDLRAHHALLSAWQDQHRVVAVLAYAGAATAVAALSAPGTLPLTLAAGLLFGLVPGTLVATAAATLGATLVFLAARAGPGAALRRRAAGRGGVYDRIARGLAAHPVSCLLLLRLVPMVPFPVANVAPAFFGVSARLFFATTFLGILPGTFLTAWIGVGIGEVFDRGDAPDLGILLAPHVLGPMLGLAALAALPLLLGARRRP